MEKISVFSDFFVEKISVFSDFLWKRFRYFRTFCAIAFGEPDEGRA